MAFTLLLAARAIQQPRLPRTNRNWISPRQCETGDRKVLPHHEIRRERVIQGTVLGTAVHRVTPSELKLRARGPA